jgi:hypothetical protein
VVWRCCLHLAAWVPVREPPRPIHSSLFTPYSSLLTPHSSLLTPHQDKEVAGDPLLFFFADAMVTTDFQAESMLIG